MKKYAIYDFCQTIVDFETADAFVRYVRSSVNNDHMKLIEFFRNILFFSGILRLIDFFGKHKGVFLNKKILLYELKGLNEHEINSYGKQFYSSVIKEHFITEIIDHINKDRKDGYEIVIVSASYLPIIKPFCDLYNIDLLVTNEFEYDDKGIFSGKIIGKDCIFKNKVAKFLKACPDFVSNRKYSKSYADSRTDIPILELADAGYVVSHISHKKWIDGTGFREIIWK